MRSMLTVPSEASDKHTVDFNAAPFVQQYRADLPDRLHRQLAPRAPTNGGPHDDHLGEQRRMCYSRRRLGLSCPPTPAQPSWPAGGCTLPPVLV